MSAAGARGSGGARRRKNAHDARARRVAHSPVRLLPVYRPQVPARVPSPCLSAAHHIRTRPPPDDDVARSLRDRRPTAATATRRPARVRDRVCVRACVYTVYVRTTCVIDSIICPSLISRARVCASGLSASFSCACVRFFIFFFFFESYKPPPPVWAPHSAPVTVATNDILEKL